MFISGSAPTLFRDSVISKSSGDYLVIHTWVTVMNLSKDVLEALLQAYARTKPRVVDVIIVNLLSPSQSVRDLGFLGFLR